MEYNWKSIGKRIRDERKKLGFSQDDLVEKLGYSTRQEISKWERAKDEPQLRDLTDLCKIFDCEIGYLLCEHNCKTGRATDVQNVTGLSEDAINILQNVKNSNRSEILLTLSNILEHTDFINFLSAIHTHASKFNIKRLRVNSEAVARVLECSPDMASKYLEESSISLIESSMTQIVKNIYLSSGKPSDAMRPKRLF